MPPPPSFACNCGKRPKIPCLIGLIVLLTPFGWSQRLSRLEREQAEIMLKEVASDVRNDYYDPKLHGVDWDGKVSGAKAKLATEATEDTVNLVIASVFESLGDSHTYFVPPRNPVRIEYGWRFQMIGNRCFVTQVRPKSDAEKQGLRPGDEVLTVEGFTPERASIWKMGYALQTLRPQSVLRLNLRDSTSKVREVDVRAHVRQLPVITDLGDLTGRDSWRSHLNAEDALHLLRVQWEEFGDSLIVLKLPAFLPANKGLPSILEKARGHKTLIVDLRGNAGGEEGALQYLLGSMFEKDVKIADRVARAQRTPLIAKGSGHDAFAGKLFVLVDSKSASAAEIFSRVVQLEQRGLVLGDRTSGSVMEAQFHHHQTGLNPVISYGAMVAQADFIMSDGKSLEQAGVIPDETILPSAEDLANGRDPVLARAAELAGVNLSAEKAGRLFPYEWPKE